MDGKGHSLLGQETATKLCILRIGPETVNKVSKSILDEYQDVITGFGKLKNFQLDIPIIDEVNPVVQPVRRIPFHLRSKLEAKLDELEALDVIEKVNEPTKWLSPAVCVPKGNGDIRLCIDMRLANRAVARERFPIPTVEEVIQDLNRSTVFSKLDLKMGYFQIELAEDGRSITTFGTHKGPYRYKRLIIGISCAPENFVNVPEMHTTGSAELRGL